jgi:tubulin--tyrosine ligase
VYCVASGALKLFICRNILALFAGAVYVSPSSQSVDDPSSMDLSPHLTNTALQSDAQESNVRLLRELAGCNVLSDSDPNTVIRSEDVQDIEDQVSNVLAETFKAALASAVHFQVAIFLFKYK